MTLANSASTRHLNLLAVEPAGHLEDLSQAAAGASPWHAHKCQSSSGPQRQAVAFPRRVPRGGDDHKSHYRWRRECPAYATAFDQTQHEAADALEEEARRRAVEGVRAIRYVRDGKPLIDPARGALLRPAFDGAPTSERPREVRRPHHDDPAGHPLAAGDALPASRELHRRRRR